MLIETHTIMYMNGENVKNLTIGVFFYHVYYRMTSENVAEKFGITREEQDKFALLSQQRLVHVPGVKCQRSWSTLLHKLSWQVKHSITVNLYS